jgi:hypothetical protein
MIPIFVSVFVLVAVVAFWQTRRTRKARSAVGADGLPGFVVASVESGRVRHRAPAPASRFLTGSRGSM